MRSAFKLKGGDYINGIGTVFEVVKLKGWTILKFTDGVETGYQSWQSVPVVVWQ